MDNIDSYDELIPIDKFAILTGISESSLRHYEKAGIFSPAVHHSPSNKKSRYYKMDQVLDFKVLRLLSTLGVKQTNLKNFLDMRTPESMNKLLYKYKHSLAIAIKNQIDLFQAIETILKSLTESIQIDEDEVYLADIEEERIILGGVNDFANKSGFHTEFFNYCYASHTPEINLLFPIGGYFSNMESFIKEPSKPGRFFSLYPQGNDIKPAGRYLTGYTRGGYGQTNDLPLRMDKYAKDNGFIFDGPVYNVYLTDGLSVCNPDSYLLRVSVAVKALQRMPSFPKHNRFGTSMIH